MKDSNIISEKSYQFAVRIVNLSKVLDSKHAYALSTQVLKSGTSIGANITEAQQAQSKKDFISKLGIALKEAAETSYWLRLLYDTDYINEKEYYSVSADCKELEKLLTAIIKTVKDDND